MTTIAKRALAALPVAALLLGALVGCSQTQGVQRTADDQVRAEACRVIVTELARTGLSFAELVPSDLSRVDGAALAAAQEKGAAALESASAHVEDVRVGDVLDQASGAMDELSQVVEQASTGDVTALAASSGPLSRLAGVAADCATTSIQDVQGG